MIENRKLGEKLAKDFNKKYGIITYSCTLAIEMALKNLKLKDKAIVLVISEACYTITNAILKLGYIPLIVNPINSLYLTDEDIKNVLKDYTIDCILLVHQYGLLNNINLNQYKALGIKIIEDVAQAWKINGKNHSIGKYSDIVVTSFGKTKPLSYGIGGGLFFNNEEYFNNIDFDDNESREKKDILDSYAFPLCEKIDYYKLIKKANSIIKTQRKNAKKYTSVFEKNGNIKFIESNCDINNCWHRFPIYIDDKKYYEKFIKEIGKTKLEYQLPHSIDSFSLDRNKDCIKYNKNNKKNIILLRTRNIKINKQIKILNKVLKKINNNSV